MRIPGPTEIKAAVLAAIADFHTRDKYLLEFDLNERTISHSLADHLRQSFHPWDVDCEYNRHENGIKRLSFSGDKGISSQGTQDAPARRVFPDIIIHKRGKGPNVLVIEMKKKTEDSSNYDLEKLYAYKNELGYEYACLILIDTKNEDCRLEEPDWR